MLAHSLFPSFGILSFDGVHDFEVIVYADVARLNAVERQVPDTQREIIELFDFVLKEFIAGRLGQ
jgi:hypothetical protein